MKELTYTQAMTRLETLLAQLEEGTQSIDQLSELVTEAAELIKYCKAKLKTTESEIQQAFEGA